jgi:beta-glucanase (GH16 family)
MQHRFAYLVVFILLIGACSKKSDTPALLTVSVTGVSKERALVKSNYSFTISLEKAATSTASVKYSTTAGTAVAGTDFTPVSGTATFNTGQQDVEVVVEVTGDSLRKTNQSFFLELSNPQNCVIQSGNAAATIINENNRFFPVANVGYSTPLSYPGYTLAWNDEFSGNTLNTANWGYDIGNGPGGWGNNELQYYTDNKNNLFLSGGNMIIESRLETINNFKYTSARILTKGKKEFQYGRVDIRAKMPVGRGMWPALWMLGANIDAQPWPACGEIDIMEYLGHERNKVYGTLHWGANFPSHQYNGSSYSLATGGYDDQFHVYSMIWRQDSITIMMDDVPYYTRNKSQFNVNYPFNAPFYFIICTAVGGNFPGNPDGTSTYPQRTVIDYIRMFQ